MEGLARPDRVRAEAEVVDRIRDPLGHAVDRFVGTIEAAGSG